MDYRREIDGLRALAVVPVIFFHAGFQGFGGGFVGVDVFFVISGYLITTLILKDLDEGAFSLLKFYERRARRILPALFLVMLVSIPFAWAWLSPSAMQDFSQSLLAVSLFASNILFWQESGYFDTATELKPMLHTWSLAVEEQYYILFPIFMMIFWRFGRRIVIALMSVVFVASLVFAHWGSIHSPTATFYLLPTRGWEILLGAFAAFFLSKPILPNISNPMSDAFAWLGIGFILFSILTFTKETPFPSLYTLIPTLGAVLIIVFARQKTSAGRFLGHRAFVGIGLISYSAYLWHQPIFAFARVYTFDQLDVFLTWAAIGLTLILAIATYHLVETPFRNRSKFNPAHILAFSLIGTVGFVSFGYLGHIKQGFPGPYAQLQNAFNDWAHPGDLKEAGVFGYYKLHPDRPVDVLFFGDSHAQQFAPLAAQFLQSGKNLGILAGGGCAPIPNLRSDAHVHCPKLFESLAEILQSEPQIETIFVSGCFNCYFILQSRPIPLPGDNYSFYFVQNGQKLFFRKGQGQSEALLSLTDFLAQLAANHKVVLLGDNPHSENFNPSVIQSFLQRGDSMFFKSRYPTFTNGVFPIAAEQVELNEKLRSAAPQDVQFLSLLDIVCPNGTCPVVNAAGLPIYKDGDHMRPDFVRETIAPHVLRYLSP